MNFAWQIVHDDEVVLTHVIELDEEGRHPDDVLVVGPQATKETKVELRLVDSGMGEVMVRFYPEDPWSRRPIFMLMGGDQVQIEVSKGDRLVVFE